MKFNSTLKSIAKALLPIHDRSTIQLRSLSAKIQLRAILVAILSAVLMACPCPANASEPLSWERTPNRPAPAQFDTFHGQSLDFCCTFTGFGALPFGQSSNPQSSNPPIPQSSNDPNAPRLYYQTNGMGAAWWSLPATVSSNVLAATFPPSADPGAERLTVFFGAPSNAYAAAQVRFRNSPGPFPNTLAPPSVLDWQSELSSATNALAVSLSSQMSQISKSDTNYTDLSTNTLHKSFAPTISNTVTKAYVESLGIESGVSTNDVCNIVTNEVPITSIVSVVRFDYTMEPEVETNISTSSIISIEYVKNGPPIWTDYTEEDDITNYWKVVWKTTPDSATQTGYDNYNGEDSNSIMASPDYAMDNGVIVTLDRSTRNALGLARLTDIAPTISNTVTKAYVESLGIESGVDAQTVTAIAQSALGEFANTGTVYNAENAANATDAESAMYSSSAYSLEGTDGYRTADQILAVIDESASTNYANTAAFNAVANADTTYRRTIGITNLNQSVQYVNITDTTPSTLEITMPTDGATKDWMVYVVSVTNVTLSLPDATWWMADAAYTNEVPPATPTALWFSQVTDGIFILGRQELTEVAAP